MKIFLLFLLFCHNEEVLVACVRALFSERRVHTVHGTRVEYRNDYMRVYMPQRVCENEKMSSTGYVHETERAGDGREGLLQEFEEIYAI